jgi:hypothetical protein
MSVNLLTTTTSQRRFKLKNVKATTELQRAFTAVLISLV